MSIDFTGRKAVVTGGAKGIGRAVVKALAINGAEVTFTTRNEQSAERGLKGLASGLKVHAVVCDAGDFDAVEKLFQDPIDILVNNAGVVGPIGRIIDVSVLEWAENHLINVTAAFFAIQKALPGLIKRRGTIVNLSSGAAFSPMEGWSAYCSGKAALAMITRCVDMEYGNHGVRSFGFKPGLVDTDMQGAIRQSGINPISAIPQEQLRPVWEPAQAIAWLCTTDADDLIGKDVDVREPDIRRRCGLEEIE